MKRILLTSTALVMVAGIAAADGHANIKWSGGATAGLARDGKVDAKSQTAESLVASAAAIADVTGNTITTNALYLDAVIAQNVALLATSGGPRHSAYGTPSALPGTSTAADARMIRAQIFTNIVMHEANSTHPQDGGFHLEQLKSALALLDATFGTRATKGGEFKSYGEISTTVTGTLTTDNGWTLSAGVSVDAGTGYDFADDDTFDGAKTNGVGFDAVSVTMGSAGTITIDTNGVTHLVDGDDDGTGDIKYSNTFSGISVEAVIDLAKDGLTDGNAAAQTLLWNDAAGSTSKCFTANTTCVTDAVDADVQWSAKGTMPIGTGSVFIAMDEEKGNHFGGSMVISGATVSLDSKIEALAAAASTPRSNTLGVSMPMGAMTIGANYNTLKDGDQWGVSGSYTSGAMSVALSTDEGSDWTVNGGYNLGPGAAIEVGANYTEDAYLGLNFSF